MFEDWHRRLGSLENRLPLANLRQTIIIIIEFIKKRDGCQNQ